eukprot:jgi/Botrbrau1/1815/Bobra.146_1s0013.1
MLRSLSRLQGPRCGPLSRWWNCSSNAEFTCQGFNNSANLFSLLAWRTASRGFVTGAFQPSASTMQASGTVRLKDLPAIYKQLSKFRLSFLVMTTATAGFIAGSGEKVDWAKAGWTSAGTFCCAAAANTLNQVYEVANDKLMKRTSRRPLPMGKVTRGHALAFAGSMGLAGISILISKTNELAAGLGAGNILLYAAVYTPLKVVSISNTWVGALVGAVPPLLGWAAASGSLPPASVPLAAALYFWQLPHFLSLAYICREDYARGGYRMLTLTDITGRRTGACALRNALYLLPLGLAATWLGLTTPPFAYESTIASGVFAMMAATFWGTPGTASARLVFRASLLYLPAWMGALLVHRIPQDTEDQLTWEALALALRDLWNRHGWFLFHPLGYRGPTVSQEVPVPKLDSACPVKLVQGVTVAPFPFLPVPLLIPSSPALSASSSQNDTVSVKPAHDEDSCRGGSPTSTK